MTKTPHYKGHRWTTKELRTLMELWAAGAELEVIADTLNATTAAVAEMVQRMRKNGIPLERRRRGHIAGRSNKLWTQGEVEFLVRRRMEKATSEEIAMEIGRTWNAVSAMITKLRNESVPIAMRGQGVRRLWNAEALKAVTVQAPEANVIELNAAVA